VRSRPEPLTPTSVISREASELRAAETAREAARTPAGDPVRWFVRLVVEIVHKADRDRMLGLAAETAFFAVLTLFPALLVGAAVLGQLSVLIGEENAARVENGVLEFLDTVLTDTARPAVDTARGLFEGSGGVLTLASLLALVSLSTAFATLINTVNITYDVPETRGWWRRRLLGLLLGAGTVLVGALTVTLIVIGPLFGAGEDAVMQVGLDQAYSVFWSWVRWPLAFGALVVWATTMDHFAPATRSPWRYDLPGGLLTALLWLAASYGLNVYVRTVVTSSPIFGALGGGLILMTWVYLLTVALLAGGELNAILLARRRHRAEVRARAAVQERPIQERAVQDEPATGKALSAGAPSTGAEHSDDAPRTVELDPPRESGHPVVLRPRGRG
jgi:membrane protein